MPVKKKAKKKVAAKKKVVKKTAVKKKVVTKKTTKKKVAAKKKVVKKKTVTKKTAGKNSPPSKKKISKKTPASKKKVSKKTSVNKKKVSKKSPISKKKVSKKKPISTKKVVKKTMPKKVTPITSAKTTKTKASTKPVTKAAPSKPKFNENYMNVANTEHFRKLLNDWKQELMEEVDRTVHHMQDEAANFPDPNDRATQEEEFALELRTRDRERKLIKKIHETLANLDAGDYGYCEVCGVEIGVKRLEARPTATLCIDCKTLDEIKERQLG